MHELAVGVTVKPTVYEHVCETPYVTSHDPPRDALVNGQDPGQALQEGFYRRRADDKGAPYPTRIGMKCLLRRLLAGLVRLESPEVGTACHLVFAVTVFFIRRVPPRTRAK